EDGDPFGPTPADPEDVNAAAWNLDLSQVPRRLWEAALAPLHYQRRYRVAQQTSDPADRSVALRLAVELESADVRRARERDERRHRARRASAQLPSPDGDHAAVRPTVQVNLRLRGDDHQRLLAAARAAGLRPTSLARALVLNGVAQILREPA
ncbi:MAG: hypothetical protein M3296_01480, partial [Actinomycetota bacterium]|nr:hypothetical protein [Actinomycetota bacterium]